MQNRAGFTNLASESIANYGKRSKIEFYHILPTFISILQRFWSVRYECVGTDSCDSGERARPAAVGSRGSSLEPFFGSRSFWDAEPSQPSAAHNPD